MAYKKSYKKKRSYGKKKTFTKKNLYTHKTAKNQATQIYRLNKKVNAIERRTKPEIKVINQILKREIFTEDGQLGPTHSAYKETHGFFSIFEDNILNLAKTGHIYMGANDRLLRLQSLKIYGEFKNYNMGSPYINQIDSNVDYYYQNPYYAYLKIFVCQLPYGGGRRPERITQSIKDLPSDTENVSCILGPLVPGVSSQLKIIKKKTLKVDLRNPIKLFKFKIKRFNYRKPSENTDDAYGKNELLIYYQYYTPIQIGVTEGGVNRYVYPQCGMQLYLNGAYINEDIEEQPE